MYTRMHAPSDQCMHIRAHRHKHMYFSCFLAFVGRSDVCLHYRNCSVYVGEGEKG